MLQQRPSLSQLTRSRWLMALGVITGLLLVITVGWLIFSNVIKKDSPTQESSSSVITAESGSDSRVKSRIRIIATGDTIAHDALNNQAVKADGGYDYFQFMKNLKPYFEKSDIRFCNQAVLGGGEAHGISGYPIFNSPTEVATDLAKLGCNVVNLGTNHTNDKTQAAIDDTVSSWDGAEGLLAVAGANRSEAERQKVRYFSVEGIKFALLSYTTYSNSTDRTAYGLTRFDERLVRSQLEEARNNAEFVIVSMRWGTEYSNEINALQERQSQLLAENGADIVLGHGPHVLQPVKKLTGQNGRPVYVWYSLGNFLNAQLEAESLFNGLAVIDIDMSSKQIIEIGYLPVYMHYEWSAEEKNREDLLARRNFQMYVIDDAAEPLARSQLNTSVEVQQQRIHSVLNRHTDVKILRKDDF